MTASNGFMTKRQRSGISVRFSEDKYTSNKITLYEELRLIERNENEVNFIWKGAHMLMFFLAFVFGTLCTCCFHMLMHMFDNKCVLFPKLVSHSSIRHIVHEFFSIRLDDLEDEPDLPPDYVSTQWSENSVCYLPTYVPLMSGLGGLVWTTMFLMCSSGSGDVSGAHRHWRALPLIFIFSVAMSGLCIYSSVVTHSGLRELCMKLAEVTGSTGCTYTINVTTLAYERRIRGVYQATRLTIASAWLHTGCWVLSALLVVARMILAVDFTLVSVKAQLVGNMDDMMQKFEDQINYISPEPSKTNVRFAENDSEVELYAIPNTAKNSRQQKIIQFQRSDSDILNAAEVSELSLVPEEKYKLKLQYIRELVKDIVDNIHKPDSSSSSIPMRITDTDSSTPEVARDKSQTNMHVGMNTAASDILDAEEKSNIKNKVLESDSDRKITRSQIPEDSVLKIVQENDKEASKNEENDIKIGEAMDTASELTLTPFYGESSSSDEIAEENKITPQNQKKDQNIEQEKAEVRKPGSFDKIDVNDKVAPEDIKNVKTEEINSRQLHISDDIDGDDKTTTKNDISNKSQKKQEKKDDKEEDDNDRSHGKKDPE